MKKNARAVGTLLLLCLVLSLFGCIHYVPREEDTTVPQKESEVTDPAPEAESNSTESESDTKDTSTQDTADESDTEGTGDPTPDTSYPNLPDDEHSKRY